MESTFIPSTNARLPQLAPFPKQVYTKLDPTMMQPLAKTKPGKKSNALSVCLMTLNTQMVTMAKVKSPLDRNPDTKSRIVCF
mmetsp:Transcript_6637/g.9732  ORF Transcript_6637/g.9732 Transcript_6637/m.9732 type:complete len:82 (+) Transcript_6637:863-1108(+)